VLGLSGAACVALGGAFLDVWQADDAGRYDNDGTFGRPRRGHTRLRGRLDADRDGNYRFTSIHPGRYLNGRQYRPSHVHVKLAADGFRPLTTQLYFPGDPYNDIDPFIKESLVMAVDEQDGKLHARFDFVLAPRG
jgi:catechol 1,2-dioxygenase